MSSLRRTSLAVRISLLTTSVAVIAALVAGLLGIRLIGRDNLALASRTLSSLATSVQAEANTGTTQPAQNLQRLELRVLKVQFVLIDTSGQVVGGTALARAAVSPADVTGLLAGGSISTIRTVDGVRVLIQGRPTRNGAIVLLQRRADAVAVGQQAIRRLLLSLIIGVAIAIALGALVGWRMSRPLRRTAAAAHALASGQRAVVVDPTGPLEVAEVAEAVNSLSAALAQSEGRQREFLMSVSHDLRTPLTAITGYAESLAEGIVGADQTAAVGAVMLAEARRLERLVADLLDLSRLDARDVRIDITSVEVGDVVRAAGAVWAARCAAAGVRFSLEVPPLRLPTHTDAARLRQVLDGLLENALRVTPPGAPIVLAARVETAADGRRVVAAEVRDGGPGLTDDDLAVAFDRGELYRRYRGVREVGSGLGLAIVHRLVQRLGATVQAGRAPEGGARFTVRLLAD